MLAGGVRAGAHPLFHGNAMQSLSQVLNCRQSPSEGVLCLISQARNQPTAKKIEKTGMKNKEHHA